MEVEYAEGERQRETEALQSVSQSSGNSLLKEDLQAPPVHALPLIALSSPSQFPANRPPRWSTESFEMLQYSKCLGTGNTRLPGSSEILI